MAAARKNRAGPLGTPMTLTGVRNPAEVAGKSLPSSRRACDSRRQPWQREWLRQIRRRRAPGSLLLTLHGVDQRGVRHIVLLEAQVVRLCDHAISGACGGDACSNYNNTLPTVSMSQPRDLAEDVSAGAGLHVVPPALPDSGERNASPYDCTKQQLLQVSKNLASCQLCWQMLQFGLCFGHCIMSMPSLLRNAQQIRHLTGCRRCGAIDDCPRQCGRGRFSSLLGEACSGWG